MGPGRPFRFRVVFDDAAERAKRAAVVAREQDHRSGAVRGETGIIRVVESAFGDRWGVEDHLKLEELPRTAESSQMDQALKQFKADREKIAQKVESFKEQQAQKQRELFSEIEKKLKKDLAKK